LAKRLLLLETIPEGTFGRYILELMQKKSMTIQQLRSQVSTGQTRITQAQFYGLVRGSKQHGTYVDNGRPADRTGNWIDLIVLAQVLDSDPIEMIAMYMANKSYYKDLSEDQRKQVASTTYFLTLLTYLPQYELDDLKDIATMKAKRHRVDLDQVRDSLHMARYASQHKRAKQKVG
jgi:hypothetical protein